MAAKKKFGTNGTAEEWSKTGTCLNKPDDGWIHTANQLERASGITYTVRVCIYCGSTYSGVLVIQTSFYCVIIWSIFLPILLQIFMQYYMTHCNVIIISCNIIVIS